MTTPTGWRLVGPAVDLVSDSAAVAPAAALRDEDILYAASFLVHPRGGKGGAVSVVLSVLNAALSPVREEGQPLSRDGSVAESSGRFHAVEWETFTIEDRWAGELTWIHPHPVVAGVPCTTHVAITERGRKVELTVHVGAHRGLVAVRGSVGAGQTRPAFLAELNRVAQLGFDRGSAEPRELEEAAVPGFVRNVLLSDTRTHPVAVLAPVEPRDHTEPAEYLVPPAQLAEELLGLAHLYVVDRHATTYRLTDVLGDKRLSCYWGALRVYMPDFSCADSGMQHPLLVADRVEDPVERAGLLGRLGREARDLVRLRSPVAELREEARPRPAPAPAVRREAETPREPAPLVTAEEGTGSSVVEERTAAAPEASGMLAAAFDRLADGLTTKLDDLVHLHTRLIDEVARLRTATVVRAANAAGVERRLGQFERLLREHIGADAEAGQAAAEMTEPEEPAGAAEREDADLTLVSAVQHAESEYSDALLILDSAIASAASSAYEDVHRVAMNLKAMAELARRRQEGKLGMSLRDAFAEAGIDYRGAIAPTTSKRQRQQYLATLPSAETVECHEHIVLGSSYDPRYCLRIYFTSRAPGEPRFVIAHVGRHFEVITTT